MEYEEQPQKKEPLEEKNDYFLHEEALEDDLELDKDIENLPI